MPFPLAAVPGVISLGTSLYKGLRGGSRGPGGTERRYGQMLDGAIGDLGARSSGFGSRFETDLEGFDPEALFAQSTEAELDQFDDDFAKSYSSRLGSMVGQGRTPASSGFGLRDAQETIRQGQGERARIRQRGAENLAGARMNLLGMRGNYATGLSDRYMGALSDRFNTLESQRLADNADRRSLWGSVLGAGASAAGSYFGARGR